MLGLFALSPVPSAQLFEAAGLMNIRLLPFTAAFFVGRLVSYALYVAGAKTIEKSSIGEAFVRSLTSPGGMAIQVVMIVLLIVFTRIDWATKFAP